MSPQEIHERVSEAVAGVQDAHVEVQKYPYEFVVRVTVKSESQSEEVQRLIEPLRKKFDEEGIVVFFIVGTPQTIEKLSSFGGSESR